MRWTVIAIAATLLAAPALSGCIGGSGGDEDLDETSSGNDPASNESNSSEGNNTSGDAPPGGNETGSENETEEPGTTWTYDNRTGSVSGTNAIVHSEGSEQEEFTVEPNALKLGLNLSAEGGELEMCVSGPSGNESDNGSGEQSCDETVTTEDGNATFAAEAPEEGDWTVTLRPAETGRHSIDYELVIAQLVEEEGSSGF